MPGWRVWDKSGSDCFHVGQIRDFFRSEISTFYLGETRSNPLWTLIVDPWWEHWLLNTICILILHVLYVYQPIRGNTTSACSRYVVQFEAIYKITVKLPKKLKQCDDYAQETSPSAHILDKIKWNKTAVLVFRWCIKGDNNTLKIKICLYFSRVLKTKGSLNVGLSHTWRRFYRPGTWGRYLVEPIPMVVSKQIGAVRSDR